MNNFIKELWGWVRSFGLAFVITLIVSTFIVQPSKVDGHSMDPTLHDKQLVFVSKIMHTLGHEPDYGDIVIIDSRFELKREISDELFDNPLITLITKNVREKYIKRVIGKAGDVLEFKDQHVYRNGQLLDESYIKEKMRFTLNETILVPEDHIFVMGDNRNHSTDSRDFGCIPLSHVLGKKL